MSERKPLFSVTIHDMKVQTFRSGGKGGQNQNKVNSGVRIIHEPSGAVGESREHRDQLMNKRAAFFRLAETKQFKTWLRMEVARRMGLVRKAEEATEEAMDPRNLRVEVKDENNLWIEESKAEVVQMAEAARL